MKRPTKADIRKAETLVKFLSHGAKDAKPYQWEVLTIIVAALEAGNKFALPTRRSKEAMRIECPHCHQRFDVKHAAVLAEARRLAEKKGCTSVVFASHGGTIGPKRRPTLAILDDPEDGNRLDPADEQAQRERAEAIRLRTGNLTPV